MNIYTWKCGRRTITVCAESLPTARTLVRQEAEARYSGYADEETRKHFIKKDVGEVACSPDSVMPTTDPWVKHQWITQDGNLE